MKTLVTRTLVYVSSHFCLSAYHWKHGRGVGIAPVVYDTICYFLYEKLCEVCVHISCFLKTIAYAKWVYIFLFFPVSFLRSFFFPHKLLCNFLQVIYSDEERKFNKHVIISLIRSELLNLAEYNVHMAKLLDGGWNSTYRKYNFEFFDIQAVDIAN